MAKRKRSSTPQNNDTKVASIVVALFVLAIIGYVVFTKHKVSQQEARQQRNFPSTEGVDRYIPTEAVHPVESVVENKHITSGSFPQISGKGAKIAFIIDDWGQSTANCRYLREIPDPIAVSILPGLRHTQDVASCAGRYHKLTMLHLPLEALHNFDFYPPNYIIKTNMPSSLASKIVDDDLNQLPSIEGVNNHMGSKATENRPLMRLIFKKLKKRGLFFVDSMTAHNTVCGPLADEMDLEFGKRDVFLDNVNTRDEIIKQMVVLAQKARRKGYAVAIGHDRHLTMQVLKEEIILLKEQGFQIVSIKELLKNR